MINTKKCKYVIVSPRQKWGGAIALHALCKYLSDLGYEASIFYTEVYGCGQKLLLSRIAFIIKWLLYSLRDWIEYVRNESDNDYPVKNCKRKYLPFVSRNTIVVYPDVIYGNPLNSKKTVRWFLYYNRYDKVAYGKDDLFLCFRQEFNDLELNPLKKEVKITYYNLDLYKQVNFGERKGTCYLIRKGKNRTDLPKNFDGIVIDELSETEKVKCFNECEYFISYDTQTAYSAIASICGCVSIIMPEQEKILTDYRNDNDPRYGVAIGNTDEQIQYSINTRDILLESFREKERNAILNTKRFVEYCEEHFGAERFNE